MDIFNCIMGSDNRILKLEPSFLNKMQIIQKLITLYM